MSLSQYILLAWYAIGLRWFLFCFKHTGFIRYFLRKADYSIINALMMCPYCQSIETATVLFFYLRFVCGEQYNLFLFAPVVLSIGLTGMIAAPVIDWAVSFTEGE